MEKAATTVFSLALVFMKFFIALGGGEANYTSSDESALLAFKSHITYDPNHILATNWSTNTSFCHWLGVSCRRRGQNRVTSLHLSNMGLNGTIPPQIGNLSLLTYFNISYNYFNGHLPTELGQLRRLKVFTSHINDFSGEIPTSIFNVSSIQQIDFDHNSLSGSLPDDVCSHLPKLKVLLFSYNKFSGDIPSHWGGCRELQYLSLYVNNFTGFIPRGIGNLTLLQGLYLWFKQPPSSDVHGLEILALASNQLTGSFPQCISNYTSLEVLDLPEKKLSGFQQQSATIPWSFLLWFDISSNKLQGLLPVPPPSTVIYKAHDNALTGPIPPSICHNNSLYELDLSNNNLNGTIPPCLASYSEDLRVLNLSGNSFHGNIPSTFTMNSQLATIDLGRNQLQGPVPRSLANCAMLECLALQNNQIEDTFPFWLGALPKLEILLLGSNKFHGHIGNPKNNSAFQKLQIVDLSCNGFSGNLPSEYIRNWNGMKMIKKKNLTYMGSISNFELQSTTHKGQIYVSGLLYTYSMKVVNKGIQMLYEKIPSALVIVDLSNNTFVGDIPESFATLSGLQLLNISNNKLIGAIPPSLAKLTELESLDLSQNLLSGQIPWQLTQLTFLAILNVSHNQLIGPIPRGKQFDTYENSSYDGNSGLCGVPLSKLCGNPMTSPPPPSIFQGHGLEFSRGVYWMVIALGYGSGLVVGLVIGTTLTGRYHCWFVETFGREHKLQKKQKRKGRRT